MAAVMAVLTAAMIRCVDLPAFWRLLGCEVCGVSRMAHRTESGESLCGSCLVARRAAFRTQSRTALLAQRRAEGDARHAAKQAELQARRDFEGDVDAHDLAVDGYYDVFYEEFSPSEAIGPKPRWIEETTLTERVAVRPSSLLRALFALMVAEHFPQPRVRANALMNARIQLSEALVPAKGQRDVTVMYDGTDDRDMGDDVMSWLHRDPSNRSILSRWNRPDDELAFMEEIRESGRESEWWELMVDFRRRKLDALLKEYFGLDDYRASMIVLKWEKGSGGRWKPAKQMNVVDWVKWSCEESGSILGGLQSCTRSIQVKTQLRKRKEAKKEVVAMKAGA